MSEIELELFDLAPNNIRLVPENDSFSPLFGVIERKLIFHAVFDVGNRINCAPTVGYSINLFDEASVTLPLAGSKIDADQPNLERTIRVFRVGSSPDSSQFVGYIP